MEANFVTCLKHVFDMEGGFSNDPDDHGGATNWGITQATLVHWRGDPAADTLTLTRDEARAIYHTNYWNSVRCGELPGGVDLVVFDVSVNSGPDRAAKMLQTALGAVVDGLIGPATMRAVAKQSPLSVVMLLDQQRRAFYRRLVHDDPTQEKFLKGWLNRVDATTKTARTLVI